jgi:hypothetical protein
MVRPPRAATRVKPFRVLVTARSCRSRVRCGFDVRNRPGRYAHHADALRGLIA